MSNHQTDVDMSQLYRELEDIDDPRLCVARVQERMRKFKEAGREVPDDLVRTERRFQTECMLQSQGR